MIRHLIPWSIAVLALAGCCNTPPPCRLVPTATIFTVEPQPATVGEFRSAEAQGYLVAATGRGPALGTWDEPVRMVPGERLRVLRVNARTGEMLVKRVDSNSLARLSAEGLEVRDTTFGR